MEGLVRERKAKLHMGTEERVRIGYERLFPRKIEYGQQRALQQHESLKSLDTKLSLE